MEYLYGLQPVLAALRSSHRKIFQLLLYEKVSGINSGSHTAGMASGHLANILKLAQARNIRLQYTTRSQLDALCGQRPHQNVALQVHPLRMIEASEPLPAQAAIKDSLSLLLVDVTDPQNVGNILRTASFYGIQQIYLTRACSTLSPTVSKASAGALETLGTDRIRICRRATAFLEAASRAGWLNIASGSFGSLPDLSERRAVESSPKLLVLGSEGKGISASVSAQCQHSMSIAGCLAATSSGLDSLNVGTAAAILIDRLLHRVK